MSLLSSYQPNTLMQKASFIARGLQTFCLYQGLGHYPASSSISKASVGNQTSHPRIKSVLHHSQPACQQIRKNRITEYQNLLFPHPTHFFRMAQNDFCKSKLLTVSKKPVSWHLTIDLGRLSKLRG